MNKTFVFPIKSTYLSSKRPNTNFFDSNILKIGKCHNDTQYTLLNFPLNVCNKEYSYKWYLYLPLNHINCCYDSNVLSIDMINNRVNYSSINYHDFDKLCIRNYNNSVIDATSIYEKYVMIDVSSLVNQCMKAGETFCNILIGVLGNDFSVFFDKCNVDDIPKLIIEDNNSYDSCSEPVAIELQINPATKNRAIGDNEVVKFNHITTKTPTGIEYDVENGEIRILRKGYYMFHWNFCIEGSTYINTLNIGLKNNSTGMVLPYPAPTAIQCQISGMSLVEVNEVYESFSLVNLSGGDLLLTDVEPCGSVIVNRI